MRLRIFVEDWNDVMEQLNLTDYKIKDGEHAIIYFTDPESRSILAVVDNENMIVYCMSEREFEKIKSYFEEVCK